MHQVYSYNFFPRPIERFDLSRNEKQIILTSSVASLAFLGATAIASHFGLPAAAAFSIGTITSAGMSASLYAVFKLYACCPPEENAYHPLENVTVIQPKGTLS